ncbi:MAG: RdgB/HAM1 family non-canonical purine NTP pyrophosphatase [Woeseia sp.]
MANDRLVFASANPGKLGEVRKILAGLNCEIVPQGGLGISPAMETGTSFVHNAMIKARHAARISRMPAIADDSGLVVDALHGRPGVSSARYAGEDANDDANIDKLLDELGQVPTAKRTAHYECAAVWVSFDDSVAPLIAEGQWHGSILTSRRGTGGFGYDPIFLDPLLNKTGAEMSIEEKNRRSHRGEAFRRLADLLRK